MCRDPRWRVAARHPAGDVVTAPLEPTIAHGGTRLGETIPITVTELRHCDELRAMESRLLALVAASELISPDTAVPLAALRGAIAGAV